MKQVTTGRYSYYELNQEDYVTVPTSSSAARIEPHIDVTQVDYNDEYEHQTVSVPVRHLRQLIEDLESQAKRLGV